MKDCLSVVMVSTKLKYCNTIQRYLHPNVLFLSYRNDVGYDGIIAHLSATVGNQQIQNLALILYNTPFAVYLCSNEGKVQPFSHSFLLSSKYQLDFFRRLNSFFCLDYPDKCRLDILSCNLSSSTDVSDILGLLQDVLQIPCTVSKELWGSDVIFLDANGFSRPITEIYFSITNLSLVTSQQTINAFERIRTVGKGAYGTAVLYRKKDDDSLVILKEINMHDLSASERLLAMNEVKVLSLLDHPNIVAYFDSFEEDGVLLIEMEYADNGTLQQYLSNQEKPLEESKILDLFQQIVAAIHYIHEHKILHRDLKTANIFLTKEEIIKVGDFGISKMLTTTKDGASSVLGTPYYISPEMCQGQQYNEKSDVWALGCILYEMACLHRTFEGSNLPALVNKILKGYFEPVKGNYSDELKELISFMLEKNPSDRLSTAVILYHKLPMMIKKFQVNRNEDNNTKKFTIRSVLYEMSLSTLKLSPIKLPSRIRIKQVCSGANHIFVLTTERSIFSWGQNEFGQLGHGDTRFRRTPELVTGLSQKSLIRVACGNDFSIFGSENGIIMTCGSGISGCLGQGDFRDILKPKLIESLLSVDIVCITSTHSHVVVVTSEGTIYAWGSNKNGQLGLEGNNLFCSPQLVRIKDPVHIRNAFTSEDGTILLTDAGRMLASGNNYGNKLGLNARLGFLMTMKTIAQQPAVTGVNEFTNVRSISRDRISDVSMGKYHTIVLSDSGKVISFGLNIDGQLGSGNSKIVPVAYEIKALKKHKTTKVFCGTRFSVACVNYEYLYFWGRRQYQSPLDVHDDNDDDSQNLNCSDQNENYLHSPTMQQDSLNVISSTSTNNNSCSADVPDDEFVDFYKIYPNPTQVFRVKNSDVDVQDKELITLADCVVFQDRELLVQIDTTAPPPPKKRRKRFKDNLKKPELSLSSNSLLPSIYHGPSQSPSDDASESDTMPTWVRNELLEAALDSPGITQSNPVPDISDSNCLSSVPSNSLSVNKPKKSSSNNSLRIYSSTNDLPIKSSLHRGVSSNSLDTISLPTGGTRKNEDKSQRWVSANRNYASREDLLQEQLNNLQITVETQQKIISENNHLINRLQNEITKMKRDHTELRNDPSKMTSAVCVMQ